MRADIEMRGALSSGRAYYSSFLRAVVAFRLFALSCFFNLCTASSILRDLAISTNGTNYAKWDEPYIRLLIGLSKSYM